MGVTLLVRAIERRAGERMLIEALPPGEAVSVRVDWWNDADRAERTADIRRAWEDGYVPAEPFEVPEAALFNWRDA